MSLAFDVKRSLQLGGALAFIVLSALSAAQSRSDPLAEAYVLALICVSTIGLVVGGASVGAKLAIRSERGSRDARWSAETSNRASMRRSPMFSS